MLSVLILAFMTFLQLFNIKTKIAVILAYRRHKTMMTKKVGLKRLKMTFGGFSGINNFFQVQDHHCIDLLIMSCLSLRL